MPTLTDGDWKDEEGSEELEMLERREELAKNIQDIDAELKDLLAEVVAVDAEIREGGQAHERMAALRRARERHSVTLSSLQTSKGALTDELRGIDKRLFDADPET